jgi:hypothetical protein
METLFFIIVLALLLLILRPRSPEREIVVVPISTPQNEGGCLRLIIDIFLILLVIGLLQSYLG